MLRPDGTLARQRTAPDLFDRATFAPPRNVLGPVTIFVLPAADFVTGQVLYVDGGTTARQ